MKNLFHFAVACFACAFSLSAQDEPISYSYDQSQTSSQAVEVSKDASGQGFSVVLHTKALPSMGSPEEIFAELNKLISQKTVVPLEQRYPGVHFKVKDEDLEYDRPYLDQSEDGKNRVLRVKCKGLNLNVPENERGKTTPPTYLCVWYKSRIGRAQLSIVPQKEDIESIRYTVDFKSIQNAANEIVKGNYSEWKKAAGADCLKRIINAKGELGDEELKKKIVFYIAYGESISTSFHERKHKNDLIKYFDKGIAVMEDSVAAIRKNMENFILEENPNPQPSQKGDIIKIKIKIGEEANKVEESGKMIHVAMEVRAMIEQVKSLEKYFINNRLKDGDIFLNNAYEGKILHISSDASNGRFFYNEGNTRRYISSGEAFLKESKKSADILKTSKPLMVGKNRVDNGRGAVTYWNAYEKLHKYFSPYEGEEEAILLEGDTLMENLLDNHYDRLRDLGDTFLNITGQSSYADGNPNEASLIRRVFIDELNKAYKGSGEPTQEEAKNYFSSVMPILKRISVTKENEEALRKELNNCLIKNKNRITGFYGSLFGGKKISSDDISKVVKGAKGKESSDEAFEFVRLMGQFAMQFNQLMIGMYPKEEDQLKKKKEICGMK